ncbi:MAG: hypothetical protein AAF802_01455 [Planctomycetota bacterium]
MARLPSGFRSSNRTTRQFREQYKRLPEFIKTRVVRSARAFHENPDNNGLRIHPIRPSRNREVLSDTMSVSITIDYRALFVMDGEIRIWYWIGSHSDYNNFIDLI